MKDPTVLGQHIDQRHHTSAHRKWEVAERSVGLWGDDFFVRHGDSRIGALRKSSDRTDQSEPYRTTIARTEVRTTSEPHSDSQIEDRP